jgi:branched-chain amino acid transport system substrate-binding protein
MGLPPPEALVILRAAQKLGLEDRVKQWGCSTPCNTDFLVASLGPKWNHKVFVNAELTPPDPTGTPTMNLYKAILKQYGSSVSGGIDSFSQMGFTIAEIATHALESIKGRIPSRASTRRSRTSRTSTPGCSASRGRSATTRSTSPTTSTTR